MNINDPDFFPKFDIKNQVVGQVGHGYIGQAVDELFKPHCQVLVSDKAKPHLQTLSSVVKNADIIFVAVPTPMNQDGSCHTGIVESVLQDIQNTALQESRELDDFIVVIKSTVPPGFTQRMNDRFALRIVFSPEFLTEKSSVKDFKTASRLILGGHIDDASVVYKFFESVWIDRIPENYVSHPDGPVTILNCSSTSAEATKYFTNCYLSTVVTFANEFALLCEKLGVEYDQVKTLALLDTRLSPSHLDVPGHDGKRGFGGSCFPKDVSSIRHVAKELGTGEKLFTAVVERNEEVRGGRDWEELKGRAVVEK